MKLSELIAVLDHPRVRGNIDAEVTGLCYDSRAVTAGSLFVAIRGLQYDGHAFLEQAVLQHAVAAVVQKPFPGMVRGLACLIEVPDTRKALSALASRYYDCPTRKMGLIGITGTNGKTTTAYLVKAILESGGRRVGQLGTTGHGVGNRWISATHTTPESLDLQCLLDRMARAGMDYGVLEVSSHALTQERVADCDFDVAVFTNLTRDHLDYHEDMEHYFAAKRSLFTGLGREDWKSLPRRALLNQDDPYARRLRGSVPVAVWTYGMDQEADIFADHVEMGMEETRFEVVTPAGNFPVQSALLGRYNIYNLLAAIGVGLSQEISPEAIRRGIRRVRSVPGRLEKIDRGQDFQVIVDYAHTGDALHNLLTTVRQLVEVPGSAGGRVLTVFGCGGDRDPGKRSVMGSIAAQLSQVVIITSDNPRTEDPQAIIKEIWKGVQKAAALAGQGVECLRIVDRSQAITQAIRLARRGDAVVIAGKGHEEYQVVGDRRVPCDDRVIASEAIESINARSSKH